MGFFDKWFGPPASARPILAGPDVNRVIVHVTWATPGQIAAIAPGMNAFCKGPDLLADGEYHAWITAPMPRAFDDHERLETLGEEFFHACGARHEENMPWTHASSK